MMKAAPAAVKLWQGGRQENGKRPQAYLSSTRWSTSMRTQRQGGRHHLDQRARHQRGRLEPDTWPDKIATASLAYNTASLNASELLSQLRSTYDEVYTTALSRQVHRAQAVVLKGRAAELPTPLSRPWTPTLEKSCENLQPQLATSPDFSFTLGKLVSSAERHQAEQRAAQARRHKSLGFFVYDPTRSRTCSDVFATRLCEAATRTTLEPYMQPCSCSIRPFLRGRLWEPLMCGSCPQNKTHSHVNLPRSVGRLSTQSHAAASSPHSTPQHRRSAQPQPVCPCEAATALG